MMEPMRSMSEVDRYLIGGVSETFSLTTTNNWISENCTVAFYFEIYQKFQMLCPAISTGLSCQTCQSFRLCERQLASWADPDAERNFEEKFSSCSKMNLHWNPQVSLLKVSVKRTQNNSPFSHGGFSTGKIKADPNNSFLISLSSLFPPTFPFLQEINFLLHSIWWARLF